MYTTSNQRALVGSAGHHVGHVPRIIGHGHSASTHHAYHTSKSLRWSQLLVARAESPNGNGAGKVLKASGTSEKAAKELKDIIKENKELKKQKPVSALDLPSLPRETSALLAKHLSASIALAGKMLPIHNEASRYFFIYQMLRDMVALRPGEAMVMPLKASDLMAVNSGNSDWSYSTDATWDEQRNEDSPGRLQVAVYRGGDVYHVATPCDVPGKLQLIIDTRTKLPAIIDSHYNGQAADAQLRSQLAHAARLNATNQHHDGKDGSVEVWGCLTDLYEWYLYKAVKAKGSEEVQVLRSRRLDFLSRPPHLDAGFCIEPDPDFNNVLSALLHMLYPSSASSMDVAAEFKGVGGALDKLGESWLNSPTWQQQVLEVGKQTAAARKEADEANKQLEEARKKLAEAKSQMDEANHQMAEVNRQMLEVQTRIANTRVERLITLSSARAK